MRKFAAVLVLALAHVLCGAATAEADRLWEQRAQGDNALQALRLYEKELKLNPSYEGYLKLARALMFQGRFLLPAKLEDEKIDAFTRCIQLSEEARKQEPSRLEAVFVNGLCYAERANMDSSLSDASKAKKAMEKILKANPLLYDGLAYTILGKLYFALPGWPISFGDNDKALEILRKVLTINPRNRYNYLFLSEVLWSEGFKEEAKNILKQGMALPLDPLFLVEDQDCLTQMKSFKEKHKIS